MSKNITFVTHLRYDHDDRLDNLQTIINYYNKYLPESKFIFVEDDALHNPKFDSIKWPKGTSYFFMKNSGIYYRTKALNIGFKNANTPIVVSMDTDCIVPIESILKCEKALLDDATVAWPYNGYFIDVDFNLKNQFKSLNYKYDILIDNLDGHYEIPLCGQYKHFSVRCTSNPKHHLGTGGIVFFNRERFLNIGGYSEKFIGWGCEDNEIFHRIKILEHKSYRDTDIKSICFHLYHSSAQRAENPFFQANSDEIHKVMKMTKPELLEYIKTW
jgi:predicted glycosyltransferase involved in capsule biosynthesis